MPAQAPTIALRPVTQADLPAIAEIYSHAIENTTATFDTVPKSAQDMQEWLDAHGERHPVFIAERAGRVVGWASLSQWSDRCAYADTAENSVYVHAEHRGEGVGRALLAKIIGCAREKHFHTIIARIADGNPASVRLHETVGFKRIGTMREVGRKFGRLIDVHMYQLMLKA